jgi:8-oxo-dGTP pyrophosphatase MutT (NUDIX family)
MSTDKEVRPDKRRTPKDGRKANFRLREPGFVPPFEQVTSVSVVIFTADGGMVATEDKRGKDLPGGHVAEGEDSCEVTARRESIEEAGVTLRNLRFLRAIESDFYGTDSDQLTYMVIMTAVVEEIVGEPMEGTRHLMTVAQFKDEHKSLRMALVHELIDEAYASTFGA